MTAGAWAAAAASVVALARAAIPAAVVARFGAATMAAVVALAARAAVAAAALAADPSGTPAAGGDVRTNPAAPGLVGDPLFAIAGVILLGAVAMALTIVAIRLSDRRA